MGGREGGGVLEVFKRTYAQVKKKIMTLCTESFAIKCSRRTKMYRELHPS